MMNIIYKNNGSEITKFESLKPGTVFKRSREGGDALALKLTHNKYIMLSYSNGDDWFEIGDGSMVSDGGSLYPLGRLTGIEVEG